LSYKIIAKIDEGIGAFIPQLMVTRLIVARIKKRRIFIRLL